MTGVVPAGKRWWAVRSGRTDTPAISAGRAYAEVLVVFGVFFASGIAVAAFSVAGAGPAAASVGWRDAVPACIDQVATAVLCVMVPVLVVRRRGLGTDDLGLGRRGTTTLGWGQNLRIAAWALLGLIVGSVITNLLATGSAGLGDRSAASMTLDLFHALQAGPLEEIVVLGFVVATLEQARRPRPEIVAVALLLRVSYHIYYGPGVVGILVWAAVFLWLFLRFRSLVPLIVVHSLWDVTAVLEHYWRAVGGFVVLGWLVVFIASLVSWLVYRSHRGRPTGALLAPPGWYPDPAGSGGVRWFDGQQWAPVAHPPPPLAYGPPPSPPVQAPPAQSPPLWPPRSGPGSDPW